MVNGTISHYIRNANSHFYHGNTVEKSNASPGLGSCPQPPQYIYMFPRLLLSKRQWCMMGMQSAGPLRTLALRSRAFFDVCCSKHGPISPIHHLLRDEAQHKSANEHIRRKPRKENVTVVNGIVSCAVCTQDAPSAGLRPSLRVRTERFHIGHLESITV